MNVTETLKLVLIYLDSTTPPANVSPEKLLEAREVLEQMLEFMTAKQNEQAVTLGQSSIVN